MYPILYEYEGFLVPSWHVAYVCGAVAAFYSLRYLNRSLLHPLTDRQLGRFFGLVYVAAYFGARGLHIIVESAVSGRNPLLELGKISQLGGMVFYGGFLCGSIAGIGYCLRNKLPLGNVANVAMPSLLLGLSIGRIGCFLNGDDYGIPAAGPFTILAFENPVLNDGIRRWPVQLFESLAALFGSGYAFWCRRKQGLPKHLGLQLVFYYAACRFFLEFIRGDERGWWVPGVLSTSQGISVGLIGAILMVYSFKRHRRSPSST